MKTEFINRELSWLDFNRRVLEEAEDKKNKLFERLKFLAITASNLDEFYMVRVAGVNDQIIAGFNKPDASGLFPEEQLNKIEEKAKNLVNDLYSCLNKYIIPELKKEKIFFVNKKNLADYQREYIDDYFAETIYPVLTPMAVDKSRPFPLILNKSLNIGVLLEDKDSINGYIFATVQVPSILNRVIQLPATTGEDNYIRLETIIEIKLQDLFKGHKVLCMTSYRITRNADLSIDEEGAEDLLEAIEESVKKRKWGACIRLEISNNADERIVSILKEELDIDNKKVFYINGPIDLTYLMKVSMLPKYQYLRNEPLIPLKNKFFKDKNIFEAISQNDILLHHPYESFAPVVEFVEKASKDPSVLAIKQTLYRVSGNSPIVKALEKAAENGKQVTVLVELKARFDEENNIIWAKRLEQAGCQVVYGVVGLKTHAKITLVIRKEQNGIKRYIHLGTGNYNDITATLYTDLGMFTCNPYIGSDASAVFNRLSGFSEAYELYKLTTAPDGLRKKLIQLIRRETQNALDNKSSKIIAKMNSLVDTELIQELYTASKAGVKIELIVRGICCLRAGVQGLSENIRVISIIDRYLEHSRIYYFFNDGDHEVYLSSADWMPRNLDKRVELLFPLEDEEVKAEVINLLDILLKDNVKARQLKSDDKYHKINRGSRKSLQSQLYLYEIAKNKNQI